MKVYKYVKERRLRHFYIHVHVKKACFYLLLYCVIGAKQYLVSLIKTCERAYKKESVLCHAKCVLYWSAG